MPTTEVTVLPRIVGLSEDFDGSGCVDAADDALWATNFGKTSPPPDGTSVPEPGGAMLAGIGVALLAAARGGLERRGRG